MCLRRFHSEGTRLMIINYRDHITLNFPAEKRKVLSVLRSSHVILLSGSKLTKEMVTTFNDIFLLLFVIQICSNTKTLSKLFWRKDKNMISVNFKYKKLYQAKKYGEYGSRLSFLCVSLFENQYTWWLFVLYIYLKP